MVMDPQTHSLMQTYAPTHMPHTPHACPSPAPRHAMNQSGGYILRIRHEPQPPPLVRNECVAREDVVLRGEQWPPVSNISSILLASQEYLNLCGKQDSNLG
jgi:hypothetical protein